MLPEQVGLDVRPPRVCQLLIRRGIGVAGSHWADRVNPEELRPIRNRQDALRIKLPPPIHQDPADQIVVATARFHRCPVVTADRRIRAYLHVQVL